MSAAARVEAQHLVSSAWQDQARWSETANRRKAALSKGRHCAAAAGVPGAPLERLAAVLSWLHQEL
jgi:hypothetical protein